MTASEASVAGMDASPETPPAASLTHSGGRGFLAAFVCMNLYHPAELLCAGPYSEHQATIELQDASSQYVWDSGLAGEASAPFLVRPGDPLFLQAQISVR